MRKTIRLATKVKYLNTFERKHTPHATHTPNTEWIQTTGKQPRLLRNSGFAFLPDPLSYGPCRPFRLSDYVAYKSARRTGPCLRFSDIENPKRASPKRVNKKNTPENAKQLPPTRKSSRSSRSTGEPGHNNCN